jgi:hypothetical protein
MQRIPGNLIALLLLASAAGCTNIPVDQRAAVRSEIVAASEEVRARFVSEVPGLEKELQEATGYFTARVSGGKVPLIGGARGRGVLIDNADGSRIFMNATRLDLGAGLGAGTYQILVVLETREAFEQFRAGTRKFGIGVGAAVDESGGMAESFSGDGFRFLMAGESGAALTASARSLKFAVNTDLTDVGISNVSVPGTGFTAGEDLDEDAPRIWDHSLPFLAQKVIDLGYDLPLPYGAGLVYAYNDQEQLITGLEVGINGREKEPFEFVSFDKALSRANSVNAKVDAWLFPFMNVYATFGWVDGTAPIDILIDGNGMLDHMGISCAGPVQPGLCDSLQDQDFLLPINTSFSGTTWGIGAVLAGGWNNWFVTIPLNFSRINLDSAKADGGPIVTAAPRGGYVFNLGRRGNLALFAGGNYLDAELQISGIYLVPVGEDELSFDYTVQQKNKDKWNLLAGFNWDFSKRFSLNMEYDGFIGTRTAFISSVTWRF